ncbi:rRNA (guanine-N1)-methyltransferase [Colwellia sp. MB3u-70]|uniref:pilus assembly protein n=1 Tax=unclassified Colwellia TaxID=196834 RepID=UPI0015F40BC5|nr:MULTISPECIES: PilC/PilY family type IV pilus protein [unclassified Colwellia]MBA6292432.1 rRNA (guanine-N1)-methyltransferase [Colwellia sp. MB3u-8]MBA6308643.1 rRNA (guanine-N1)-methyltransferase [Colwellia sp. MB3u-70]
MKKLLALSLLLLISATSFSEDIELYVSEAVKLAGKKNQVLIIFDNSGSMATQHFVNEDYNPNTTYPPAAGSDNSLNERFIYFSKGGSDGTGLPVPDSNNDTRRFLDAINSCETARKLLAETGFYTGHVREYDIKGNTGSWNEIPDNNGANVEIIDCEDDVLESDPTNIESLAQGYPINYAGDKQNPVYHSPDLTKSNVQWSGKLVTLYTDNYLRWHHGEDVAQTLKSRMDIAKDSITKVVKSAPSIDFGLQVFNYDDGDSSDDPNGGRVVFGIQEMTDDSEKDFLQIVDDLTPKTWTPLCETLYEAQQYFAGKSVDFGDDDESRNGESYIGNTPPRDPKIESSGNYLSPFSDCSSNAFVILITDGEPTYDNGADSKISELSTVEDGKTIKFSGSKFGGNYLPAVAQWMYENDINTTLEGKQTVETFTIGFSEGADDAAPLLKESAKLGGGTYYRAEDSVQLTAALLNALESLEPSNDSLTSASVAANNFDRTETLNSVYYSMFQPDNGPRWQGNLKKYKVVSSNQVGKHGNPALDLNSGQFSQDVTSFWSADNAKDGAAVTKGGVAEMLRNKTNRIIYSDIGSGDALALLTQTSAETSFGGSAELATALDVNENEVGTYLRWAKGENVDNIKLADDSIPIMRPDVFGDPLHSKPLVVNYGDSIRILIGTNAGALHMFEDKGDSVDESWAFMPKEFFKNIKPLRENYSTADKVYGVDGNITSYIEDNNGDGVINGTDKVWIFFGLRRGGTSYYALDISTPSSPSKLWHIDSLTTGFGRLGQSWSQPKLGYSKLNISGSGNSAVAAPVLFFGGGYDVVNDSNTPITTDTDSKGNAVYMIDAKTGVLKWSMAPAGGDTVFAGTDSIPSSIAILDSDGDGLTDRLYTGDTGGNVWRVDMPSADPADSEDPWSVFKLAELGGVTNSTDDLRFFNEPSIVRTFISETIETKVTDQNGQTTTIFHHQEKPYDAVLIGSGDRSNPLGTDTDDTFFMIKDQHIKTKSFYNIVEPKAPAALLKSDLYNYTDNPFNKTLTLESRNELARDVSKKSGWFINLEGSGEKITAEAIVINGIVFFTTFIPPNLDPNFVYCEQPNGTGLLYAVDLALGTAVYNWKKNDDVPPDDGPPDDAVRSVKIGEQFLGAPTLIVVPDANGDTIGNIIVGRELVMTPFKLQTIRTYLYIKEGA